MHFTLKAIAASLLLAACASTPPEPQWRSIFNGRNLDGWTVKVTNHPLGENYKNTFRVENGVLVVSYDQYDALNAEFGHLFYRERLSHFRIRLDYRFVGEQVAGSPAWALRNNGIMVHAQPPETVALDQPFPTSIEVQLLGSDGVTPRTTANVCTPGLSILLNGERPPQHCTNSASPSPPSGEWATIELEVRGGDVIRHIVNGAVVMEYSQPMLDEPQTWSPQAVESGYIALQAESHPTEIRNIEIMVLQP